VNSSARIDYLLVADHAVVINGLLNLIAGNFTDIFRPGKDAASIVNHFSVALSILIPRALAHQLHTFTIRLENQDGTVVLGETTASFSVGLPPNAPEDWEQHVVGVAQFNINFPVPGFYRVVAAVDNESDSKHWKFRVQDVGGT